MTEVLQYTVTGLTLGGIYAMVALGLTVIYNATGIVNFAQGEFVVVAGLLSATLAGKGMASAITLIVAVVAAATVAVVMYGVTIGLARRQTQFSSILITLGAGIVLMSLYAYVWGTEARSVSPLPGGTNLDVLGATVVPQAVWIMGATIAVMLGLFVFFRRARAGRAMLACSENREAAELMGIDVRWVKIIAFALGGSLAGLAGALIVPITAALYSTGLAFTLKAFVASVVGGFGNPIGAVIGGLALGLLEAYGGAVLSSGYRDLLPFLALVAVLMVRPGGIMGTRALVA